MSADDKRMIEIERDIKSLIKDVSSVSTKVDSIKSTVDTAHTKVEEHLINSAAKEKEFAGRIESLEKSVSKLCNHVTNNAGKLFVGKRGYAVIGSIVVLAIEELVRFVSSL